MSTRLTIIPVNRMCFLRSLHSSPAHELQVVNEYEASAPPKAIHKAVPLLPCPLGRRKTLSVGGCLSIIASETANKAALFTQINFVCARVMNLTTFSTPRPPERVPIKL